MAKLSLALVLLCALTVWLTVMPAHAQFPEGAPVPQSGVAKDQIDSQFRFGYFAKSDAYKYQGEYGADGNFLANGRQSFYGAGDILIECLLDGNVFQPNRLWGTFELGARDKTSKSSYSEIFIRHQSAHNVDNDSLPDSMFENVGYRYRYDTPLYDLSASVAYYTRRIYLNYATDTQLHGTYRAGSLLGRPVVVDGDIHYVSEVDGPRSGFTDYDLEPSLFVNKHMAVYVDFAQVHDINQPNGKTDTPIIVGFKSQI